MGTEWQTFDGNTSSTETKLEEQMGDSVHIEAETQKELNNVEQQPDAANHEQLIKEYQGQIRRTQADFENYKRRTEERMAVFIEEANSQLVSTLLPVLDNLDRALQAVSEHKEIKALQEGMCMIHRQFIEILEKAGLSKIQACGEPFEPEQYEAVAYEESTEVPPLHIVEELRAGYIFKSKVIRPALVKVAKEPNSI